MTTNNSNNIVPAPSPFARLFRSVTVSRIASTSSPVSRYNAPPGVIRRIVD